MTVLGTGREARDHVELAPPDLAIVEHELIDVDGRTLMCRADRLCTFDLLSRAIGRDAGSDDDVNAVRIGVSRLRRILGDRPRRPRIVAGRGGGYRLTVA